MEDFLAINWNASDVEWFKDLQVRPDKHLNTNINCTKTSSGLSKGSASIKLKILLSLKSKIREIR